ncbi:hypothetical protein VTJ83DRAFT_7169 [Remersonia thermophila]|uniref:HECT-type E3 ubiquitin transferase n=1 Tax=Remersonia thermophila TaxID=72144 RepID=A0ABR4D500_9PEZI
MTGDATRPASAGGHGPIVADDLDLLAGLWEEARFPRLPSDAPSELRDLVDYIDNPRRVYAIHKASRRHNFQQLVQKYIVQLREGCGSEHCNTSTCFTCRKRIVGRAPIRRYNPTSARTLAVYLASQDNPENGLCPHLKPPKSPPAAVNSLVFVPSSKSKLRDAHPAASKPPPAPNRSSPAKPTDHHGAPPAPATSQSGTADGDKSEKATRPAVVRRASELGAFRCPDFTIVEQPSSKDHRSFAANIFGTVAFKMLEWLTPAALEDMSKKARRFGSEPDSANSAEPSAETPVEAPPNHDAPYDAKERPDPTIAPSSTLPDSHSDTGREAQHGQEMGEHGQPGREAPVSKNTQQQQQQREPSPPPRSVHPRRNSNAKVRTSGPKPKRQLSIDPYCPDTTAEEPYAALVRSPRAGGSVTEKGQRVAKPAGSNIARPISQLSSAGFFDGVSLERMPSPKSVDRTARTSRAHLSKSQAGELRSPKTPSAGSTAPSDKASTDGSEGAAAPESESEDERLLPQALSRLDSDVVDFLCDVMQQDGTAEKHLLEPRTVSKPQSRQAKGLRRKPNPRALPRTAAYRKQEWKLFVEQTLFYVLSDPELALRSFTRKGQLYDSHTLWYCMLRMTRVAPTLVFHSLWLAAASLFAPPKSLQNLRSPTTKVFPKSETSLSNLDAGRLLSICLHALVAAAPLVTDLQHLYDVSRLRAHGLSLGDRGPETQRVVDGNPPVDLCLQYEDIFTDDLALRLARRLFAAISTRRQFDALCQSTIGGDEHHDAEQGVLVPLFSQLDLNSDAVYVLDFPIPDRALHESRVPILLLDWARAVLLHDWDGSPEVPADGPIGGALALIDALYKKRQELALSDDRFLFEYLAERMDTFTMPISWLSHTSTRQRVHLLDFPYIFNESTLVTYFRAINFSRMNRAFEEAASVHDKLLSIAQRAGMNQHHRELLMEHLKPASAKYLVLDIRRGSVLEDAFDQLWRREERELLRPLKVHLGESTGEEGFDSGGVQQEFFRLAIAEALHPDRGAFTVDERTRMAWFLPGSAEPEWRFELIGLLVSLAVYNGLTLPVTFPKALYRKLLGQPVTELHHIADGWPDLASGLTALLEWDEKDGSVEDVFARTYEFSVSIFGRHVTREMKPADAAGRRDSLGSESSESWPQFGEPPEEEGEEAHDPQAAAAKAKAGAEEEEKEAPLVTKENRHAYVADYIRYLTDVSVRPQFEAFARGFHACLHPKSLALFTPSLLQSVVEGVQEIDVAELRRHARYVGWDASHPTVRDFWSVVRRYDDRMKRRLLEFVTASDRVPVGGVKNLMFVVQRNGTEENPRGRLPTSYTCYGTLLLPEYKDKEMLRERLGMALENAQGFGFA